VHKQDISNIYFTVVILVANISAQKLVLYKKQTVPIHVEPYLILMF